MAKDKNHLHPKKIHSSKPYDDRNSFVKQVTSRVSRFLPRGISNWLATQNAGEGEDFSLPVNPSDSTSEDDNEEHSAPPPKRARNALNLVPANDPEFSAVRNTFVAGPSGASKRPQLVSSTPASRPLPIVTNTSRPSEHLTNGDNHSIHSDISISTSGCSSLVPQHQNETKSYTKPNRSLSTQRSSIADRDLSSYLLTSRSIFPDSSFSPRANSSLGKGRPSFNASVFSSPLSPSSASTAIDRVPSSPFYIGRTQYGGASAHKKPRHSLFTPNEAQIPARQNIQVKSLNSTNVSVLNSCTARRILDALDNLSSPVLDAKRIPTSPVLGNSRKRPAQDVSPIPRIGGPSVQDLTIPTVPDLLKLQRRAKMQDSVEAARRSASSPKRLAASSLSATEREYKMRLDGHQSIGQIGKMTTKMRDLEEEMREEVYLPSIPLPISSLPEFDFQPSKPVVVKYSFCHPTPLDSEEFVSLKPYANFLFGGASHSESGKLMSSDHSKISNVSNFIPSSSFVQPNLKEKTPQIEPFENNGGSGRVSFGFGTAQDLKVGSVMDILGKKDDTTSITYGVELPASSFGDVFKPPPGSWECTICMLRNKIDAAKCVSCETPKVSTQLAPTSTATLSTLPQSLGFGSKFKAEPGSWECDMCMVRNKGDVTTCVSCTTPKPLPKPLMQSISTPKYPAGPGFGDQFKPPSGMWECSECMVRNKVDVSVCIACTTPKPGTKAQVDVVSKTSPGFGSQFKASSDMWECASCLVRNKVGVDFCIACETKKQGPPGTLNQASIKSMTGFGDKFKKPEGSWDCPDCMLSNNNVVKCAACEAPKPGPVKESTVPSSTIKFNVTIPPEASGFKFGIDKSDVAVTKESDSSSFRSFQFGSSKPPSAATGFTFGIPVTSNATSVTSASMVRKSEDLTVTNLPTVNKSPVKPITTTTSLFSFGIPKSVNASTAVPEVVNGHVESSGSERKRKVVEDTKPPSVSNVKHFAAVEPDPLEGIKSTFSFGSASVPPSTIGNSPSKVGTSISSTVNLTSTTNVLPAPSNLFSFAASKPSSTLGGFSSTTNVFGTPSTVSTLTTTQFVSPSKPTTAAFLFGSSSATLKPSSETQAIVPAAKKLSNVPTVAASNDVGFSALASSGLSFNATASSSAPSLGTTRFGSTGTAVKTGMPSFSSASIPSFGSLVSTPVTTTDGSAKTSAPFSFGSTADISKPTTSLFSSTGKQQEGSLFGNSAVPPKAASFSFGLQNMTSPPTPAPVSGSFSFNVNPVPQKNTGGFSFGSTNRSTSSPFEATTINSLSVAPVFGATSPSPAFGGSAVVQTATAGFSFGASSQPSSAAFGFGAPPASQSTTPASTAFAFGQSQGSATFNPNVRPTFNFTGGDVPQFTAAVPANPAGQGRRIIKKAVRRGPR